MLRLASDHWSLAPISSETRYALDPTTMRLAIMQPYLFPYMGYFHLIHAVDQFVAFDGVNFITRGWINRNRILLNGKEHRFTLPLAHASQNRTIAETRIADLPAWRKKFLTTLQHAYARAAHFEEAMGLIREALDWKDDLLRDFLEHTLRVVCAALEITTQFSRSSDRPGAQQLHGIESILHICRQTQADTYVNLPGGRALYAPQDFQDAGIQLYFIESRVEPYTQQGREFVPSLSIIDVLMHKGIQGTRESLEQYVLIE